MFTIVYVYVGFAIGILTDSITRWQEQRHNAKVLDAVRDDR